MTARLSAGPPPFLSRATETTVQAATHALGRAKGSAHFSQDIGMSENNSSTIKSGAGGRDICVAISGGLASVLEAVVPLWHVGWAGNRSTSSSGTKNILRMTRSPPEWRGLQTGKGDGRSNTSRGSTPAFEEGNRNATEYDDDGRGFFVMCEGGWLGWYHGCDGNFQVNFDINVELSCGTRTADLFYMESLTGTEKEGG